MKKLIISVLVLTLLLALSLMEQQAAKTSRYVPGDQQMDSLQNSLISNQ